MYTYTLFRRLKKKKKHRLKMYLTSRYGFIRNVFDKLFNSYIIFKGGNKNNIIVVRFGGIGILIR